VEFHPSGACVGVAASCGKVHIYDIRAMKLQQLYSAHEGPVSSLSFHPSGNFLISGSQDSKIKIYDLLQARPIYTLSGHQNQVTAVSFSPKGDYFCSGGSDSQILVWKTNFDNELGSGGKERQVMQEKVVQEVSNLRLGVEEVESILETPCRNIARELAVSVDQENKENQGGNKEVLQQLTTINKNLDTLTRTVLLMEKRLTLVEDQIRILSTK